MEKASCVTHYQKFRAPIDGYGNSRAVFVFYNIDGSIATAEDCNAGAKPDDVCVKFYHRIVSLPLVNMIELPEVQCTVTTYKELLKDHSPLNYTDEDFNDEG